MGGVFPGQEVRGCIRKQAEQGLRSRHPSLSSASSVCPQVPAALALLASLRAVTCETINTPQLLLAVVFYHTNGNKLTHSGREGVLVDPLSPVWSDNSNTHAPPYSLSPQKELEPGSLEATHGETLCAVEVWIPDSP